MKNTRTGRNDIGKACLLSPLDTAGAGDGGRLAGTDRQCTCYAVKGEVGVLGRTWAGPITGLLLQDSKGPIC